MLTEQQARFKAPRGIAKLYAEDFPSDAFSAQLNNIANSDEFGAIKDVRDALSHRGALPRLHSVSLGSGPTFAALPGNPKALAENFDYSLRFEPEMTRPWADWTMRTLNELVHCLSGFLDRLERQMQERREER